MKKIDKFIKMRKFIVIVLLSLIALGSITAGVSYLYIKSKLSNIKTVIISKDPIQLGISPLMTPKVTDVSPSPNNVGTSSNKDVKLTSKITNILILGKDSRNPILERGRSDTIMILTIDEKQNKLKLTSIMRDSYVKMDGHSSQKLTNAYAFGGALFTLKTVNQNYNMNITDYVQVDLYGFAKIIDYLGGISINVKTDEIFWANYYIKEMAEFEGIKPPLVTNSGTQILSGMQAVGYSRIRYVGNSDFERTSRQRTVFTTLFDKLIYKNITEIPGVIDTLSKYVETSLTPNDIMELSKYVLIHRITTIDQSRVPYEGLYHDEVINGAAVLVWDKRATIDKLHQFIFETNGN
ncbi:LCP family protein [Clostridium estertheticum]|uniref:LCP family protein n=1 Tax=Clostridium estertheticum TaxID=238834 RepID=UPI0013E97E41|nr:LCP family protein [Clostridium estertheticum]MBZ9687742.1 LCP family protein [Clostridium estertheticum]